MSRAAKRCRFTQSRKPTSAGTAYGLSCPGGAPGRADVGATEKKPAGAIPSASSCGCRLDFPVICLAIVTRLAQPPLRGLIDRRSIVNGNIISSNGVHVGVVVGDEVFGLKGQKLYDLKGSNIYKLNGDMVGHLSNSRGTEKRLDKATDKLFPST